MVSILDPAARRNVEVENVVAALHDPIMKVFI
jgi:hypothetical protein